jgi:hypothetical protein
MASFIDYKDPINTDFDKTVERFSKNTFVFENHSFIERYVNKDYLSYKESDLGLFFMSNIIIEKYLLRIKEDCTTKVLDEDQKQRYNLNPFLTSYEILGSSNYWWIILAVNDMISINEWTNLPNIINIPNINALRILVTQELYTNKEFGALVN